MKISIFKRYFIVYIFFVFFGIFTIYSQINFDDFWLDEMNSFWIADPKISYENLILRQNQMDPHNTFFFNMSLKNFLGIFGYNPETARFIPFICGSLSLFLFGAISYNIKKNLSFLLTTFLSCICIYIIKYSQEVRPYSMLLLTSGINIFLYLKICDLEKKINFKAFIIFIMFVFFSVLNYSINPFSLIILFSQVATELFKLLFQKKFNYFFYISFLIISAFYLFFNYNYILLQISFDNYVLSSDIKNVFDGFYFPRFFGSKIMGYTYLIIFILLIALNKKKIFFQNSKYLFLFVLIIFSYLVPLLYWYVKTPVLHDRYIIFVIIPILVLISNLIFESDNNKFKKIIIVFIILISVSNHYLEILKRINTKPEFNKIINSIENDDVQNIVVPSNTLSVLILNYLNNLKPNIKNKFVFYEYDLMPKNLEKFWFICYMPTVGFDCNIPNNNNYLSINKKNKTLIEAKLYKLK